MRYLLRGLLLGTLLSGLPHLAQGQMVTLDEGSFLLSIRGTPAGTETFSISRTGAGAEAQIFARGEVDLQLPQGAIDLAPILRVSGGEMAVSAYQIRVSGHQAEEIALELGDRRFVTRTRSERGEQERESRATPGTILLDTGVAHQYYFLAQRLPSSGGTVPVIVPREGRQFDMVVVDLGSTTLRIGEVELPARHLRLSGNGETRDLWVDALGRVLRLEHTEAGYLALRERAP